MNFKNIIVLVSILIFSGCEYKIPSPQRGFNSSTVSTNKVYVLVNREQSSMMSKYDAIENNIAYMLRANNLQVTLIDSIEKNGQDGILLKIISVHTDTTVRKKLYANYSIQNNLTDIILINETVGASSFLLSYSKLANVIGEKIVRNVLLCLY